MKVENIKVQESHVDLSAKSDSSKVHGTISFKINGLEFSAETCNRCTNHLTINGETYNVILSGRIELCEFIQKIWDEDEIEIEEIEIPRAIKGLLNLY